MDDLVSDLLSPVSTAVDLVSLRFRARRSGRSIEGPVRESRFARRPYTGCSLRIACAAEAVSLDLRQLLDDAAQRLPWSSRPKDETDAKDTPDGSPKLSGAGEFNETSGSLDHYQIARRLLAILAAPVDDVGLKDILGDLGVEAASTTAGVCGARCACSFAFPLVQH